MGTFMTGFTWEVQLMEWLQATFGSISKTFWTILTYLGSETAMVAILLSIYFCIRKKLGEKLIIIALATTTYGAIIKNIVLRLRPYFSNPTIECLAPVEPSADLYDISAQGYSFPSLHSANAVAIYTSVWYLTKQKKFLPLAIALPILIGFSRSVVGCHYPTDVMVGWILGLIFMFLIPFMFDKLKKPVVYAIIVGVSLVGCFFAKSNDYFTGLGLMIGFGAGVIFEEKHSNFADTDRMICKILRLLGACIIFVVLSILLKFPFSEEFLSSATTGQFVVRTIRYAITIFVIIGIYPMVFKYYDKIKSNKEKAKSN